MTPWNSFPIIPCISWTQLNFLSALLNETARAERRPEPRLWSTPRRRATSCGCDLVHECISESEMEQDCDRTTSLSATVLQYCERCTNSIKNPWESQTFFVFHLLVVTKRRTEPRCVTGATTKAFPLRATAECQRCARGAPSPSAASFNICRAISAFFFYHKEEKGREKVHWSGTSQHIGSTVSQSVSPSVSQSPARCCCCYCGIAFLCVTQHVHTHTQCEARHTHTYSHTHLDPVTNRAFNFSWDFIERVKLLNTSNLGK